MSKKEDTVKVKDLVEAISCRIPELEKEDIEEIVKLFFEEIKDVIKKGGRVELRNFGSFLLKRSSQEFFLNPRTRQKYYIKGKVKLVFKPGRELRTRLFLLPSASLDLGTQTFRLLLGKRYEDKIYFLLEKRENVRLGEGVVADGLIKKENFEKGLEILKEFKSLMEYYEVEDYMAVGTAVFRKAKNAEEFIKKAEEVAGIKIKILSPEEEAEYSFKGAIWGIQKIFGELPERYIIVDVGGGSTEIIFGSREEVLFTQSIELGAVMLKEFFNLSYPLSSKALNSLMEYVRKVIRERVSRIFIPDLLVITGGTASILGSLDLHLKEYSKERLHGHKLTEDKIRKIIKRLSGSSLERISQMRGMEKGREDIVLPGVIIIYELLSFFEKQELVIGEYGILESLLIELLENKKNSNKTRGEAC